MDKNIYKLEYLPNEILIEIFKNLTVRCVFRAFYNLNLRFNILLQSLDHCLTIAKADSQNSNDNEIFSPYIRTLVVKDGINLRFNHLINVRRAILHYNGTYSMRDLQMNMSFNLEYFTILSLHSWSLTFSAECIRKIFSNTFPYLKSCCLPHKTAILSTEGWLQSPTLRILKIGYARSNVYQAILSSCPNLYSFQFIKWPKHNSIFHTEPHTNLKRMVIYISLDDCLNSYFLSVPKLEHLIIHLTLREIQSIKSLENSNWFVSTIDYYFPILRRFYFYIIFHPSIRINEIDHDDIINKLKEKFKKIHNDRYQSKIINFLLRMNTNLFQLEYLPNEILIEIFKNLDIQELFQAFYNLNLRFNTILHLVNNLTFTILENNYNDFHIYNFSMNQISTLNIKSEVHVTLKRFPYIRCLIVWTPTFGIIQQLNTQSFPLLEHLLINFLTSSFPYSLSRTINKVFSNQFSHLQSCYLPKIEAIIKIDNTWTQILTLKKLKVGKLNLFTYKTILISCPNLYYFKFIKSKSIETPLSSSSDKSHTNLKIMIIEIPLWFSGKHYDINIYLSYVPNLKQLTIHHAEFGANTNEYLTYDWLSSSIENYLSLLCRFNYYLEMFYFGLSNTLIIENNLRQIKEDFARVHNDKYQSRLIIIQRV